MSGSLVDGSPARLLRAHVGGRAEDDSIFAFRPSPGARCVSSEPSAAAAFARPKSRTLTLPPGVILIFAGFRSR